MDNKIYQRYNVIVQYFSVISQYIKLIVRSNKFFYIVVGVFVLQGVFLAAAVVPDIPPDESHHIGVTRLYSERPLLAGPFLDEQPDYSFQFGELTRTPSYLYHYVMSFPAKLLTTAGVSWPIIIFILRLVNVAVGVLTLYLIRKLLFEINFSQIVANLTVLGMSMTGMFVYTYAGVGYDPTSLLLFLLTVYMGLLAIKRKHVQYILWSAIFAMLVSITKHTYLPFAALALFFASFIYLKNIKFNISVVKAELIKLWVSRRKFLIITVILFAIAFGLFAERILGNLLTYRSFGPSCDRIHAVQDCKHHWAYSRNKQQLEAFEKWKAEDGHIIIIRPTDLTDTWIESMMYRLYFYSGKKIYNPIAEVQYIVMGIVFILVVVGLIFNKKSLKLDLGARFVLGMGIVYGLGVFAFNLKTWYALGQGIAWHGRYLLFSMVFVYAYLIAIAILNIKSLSKEKQKIAVPFVSILVLLLLVFYQPMITFWYYTDMSWYTEPMKQLLPHWFFHTR